jgi:hypothetical protein
MGIKAGVYANVSDVIVVWQCSRISNCLGFAVQRKDQSGTASMYLPTYMPFAVAAGASGPDPAGPEVQSQPSDVWPIQRYIWADHESQGLTAVQYQVVPVLGTPGSSQPDLTQASSWTGPVTCGTGTTPGFEMWFTCGIVASPWVERSVQAIIDRDKSAGQQALEPHAVLADAIGDAASQLRKNLAGPVLPALRSLLGEAKTKDLSIYAALYQLNDQELIELLTDLGPSCHLLLG